MAIQTWKWNNFRGGLSDNPLLGAEGTFQNGSFGIDVQTEPTGFKLASEVTASYTVNDRPTTLMASADVLWTFTLDGYIYENGVQRGTLGAGVTNRRVTGAKVMYHGTGSTAFPMIYIFTPDNVHTISPSTYAVTTNIAAFSASSLTRAIVNYGGKLYFVSNEFLYSIDNAGVLTTIFNAPPGTTFTGLTLFQDQFKIYGKFNNTDGVHYIVPVSETLTSFDYFKVLENMPIQGATNDGAIDYAVTGSSEDFSDFYVVTGTQWQSLSLNLEGNVKSRMFGGLIFNRLGEIYLAGKNGKTVANDKGNPAIFKFGSYWNGLPKVLTQLLQLADTAVIYCMASTYSKIHIGALDGTVAKVYSFDCTTPPKANYYVSQGVIRSKVLDFGLPNSIKTLDQIKIAYDCDGTHPLFPHGGTIMLQARKKSSADWTTIVNVEKTNEVGSIKLVADELRELNFGDFNQIEFQCLLTPGQTTTHNDLTPLIKEIEVKYEDGIKD